MTSYGLFLGAGLYTRGSYDDNALRKIASLSIRKQNDCYAYMTLIFERYSATFSIKELNLIMGTIGIPSTNFISTG